MTKEELIRTNLIKQLLLKCMGKGKEFFISTDSLASFQFLGQTMRGTLLLLACLLVFVASNKQDQITNLLKRVFWV